MEYNAEVLRRFNARLARVSEPAALWALQPRARRGIGEAEDRTLNVWVRFEVEVLDGRIARAEVSVFGCPHVIAAADLVVEWLVGAPVTRLKCLDIDGLRETLGVPTEKLGKLLRIAEALAACAASVER